MRIFFWRPFTVTVTFWMLGFQSRLVAFREKGRLCPNWRPLPQISHLAMMSAPFTTQIDAGAALLRQRH
jgi:hypothetical protein